MKRIKSLWKNELMVYLPETPSLKRLFDIQEKIVKRK